MNYIRHLTGFFERVCKDHRLNPTHISLYMAVFQFWNLNRFKNPLSISRSEIMELSKISSKNTYHKVMKELHLYGYFRYDPSYHPLRGSWVYLFAFGLIDEADQHKKQTGTGQALDIQETGAAQGAYQSGSETLACNELESAINISKHIKLNRLLSTAKKKNETNNDNEGKELSEKTKELLPAEKNETGKTGQSGNDSTGTENRPPDQTNTPERIPADVDTVIAFFLASAYPQAQAMKFFHYYSTTGWKLGGKTPIENWHSAAHSWMLHAQNTHTHATNQRHQKPGFNTNQLHATADKNYSEPL